MGTNRVIMEMSFTSRDTPAEFDGRGLRFPGFDRTVRGTLRFRNVRRRQLSPQYALDEEIAIVKHVAHDILRVSAKCGEVGLIPAALRHVRR